MRACTKWSRIGVGRLSTHVRLNRVALFKGSGRFQDENFRVSFATAVGRGSTASRSTASYLGLVARVVGLAASVILVLGIRKLLQLREEVPLKPHESRRLLKLMRAAELNGSETSDVVMLGVAQTLFGALQALRSESGQISCHDFAHTMAELMEAKSGTQLDKDTCELLQASAWATDRDASGTIEMREALSLFVLMLSFRQKGTSKQRAELLFNFADRDCDGYIDQDEMRSWFKSAIAMQLINPQHAMTMLPYHFLLRPAFWKMGVAGYVGSVTHRLSDDDKEIRRVIDSWCDILAQEFMKQYDATGDMRLSHQEFEHLESKLDYTVLEGMWQEQDVSEGHH